MLNASLDRIACFALTCVVAAAVPALAQEPCTCRKVATDVADTTVGKKLSVRFALTGAPGVKACSVTLQVLLKGQRPGEDQTIATAVQEFKVTGAIQQIDVDIPSVELPRVDTRLTARPPTPRPWLRLGVAGFIGVEPGESAADLGWQHASGLVLSAGVQLRRSLDVSVELAIPTTRALESELFATSSEQRYLRDVLFSGLVGYNVPISSATSRIEGFVPAAGMGFARLDTERIRYSVFNNAVRSTTDQKTDTVPMLSLGADLRIHLANQIHLMLGYRAHALLTDSDDHPRSRVLHRPQVGLLWAVGEKR